ncbi:hypothetical protein OY671_008419, partial [Metschnikowia pulcherrima]
MLLPSPRSGRTTRFMLRSASLAAVTAPVIDSVFPPRCPSCGDPSARQGGLCVACWGRLAIPGDPACALCQRPSGEEHRDDGHSICAPCSASPPKHEGITAATLYNDASRDSVSAFKHGRRVGLAGLSAQLIVPRSPESDGEWLVVPVPLHRWRLWRRGFNQSASSAARIARVTGQASAVDALVRVKQTPPSGGLNRRARAVALSGAIAASPRWASRLKGANVSSV